MFHITHGLIYDSGTEAVRSPRAEAAGEQGEHYDPLFTYREGDEAGYFAVSEESGGDATDVGPSGAGTSKESPVASSSFGWTTEGSASEGGPAIRVDSAKDFPMEPAGTDAAVKTIEATSSFGSVSTFLLLLFIIPYLNKVLLQVFHLWVHRLQESQSVFLREPGVKQVLRRR